MKIPNFLRHKISFNKICRDSWVASKARQIPEGAAVLDAGAGACPYRDLFQHCHYVTQDFCAYDGPEWKYGKIDYVCDISEIPVADETFDAILCTEVLEHVPEPIKVIQEFSRILKSSGQLFLTAPLGSGVHQVPYHFYGGLSPYWYHYFLPKYGFKNIIVTPNGGFFKHYGQETQRVMTFLFPNSVSSFWKFMMFPIKILASIYFRIFVPLLCHWLDRIDSEKQFTVGYFVEATKS